MIERWIVVGGCPRSGTTLVGNALGAVDTAIVTPEAQFAGEAFTALRDGTLAGNQKDITDFITGHWRYQIWKHPVPTDWPDMSDCASADSLCSRILGHLVSDYAAQRGRPGARIWVDHTPKNLRHVRDMSRSDLRLSLVHLIRDGRGVAASMKNVDWGPKDIATLASWWATRIAEGLAAEKFLGDGSTSIRYDDIVTDPEAGFRSLCADLGLTYTPKILTSRALEVPDYTRAQHKAVGHSPNPARAVAWKQDLSSREQEIFEASAGDVLQLLGYARLHPKARRQNSVERIGTWLKYNPVQRRFVKHARQRRRARMIKTS